MATTRLHIPAGSAGADLSDRLAPAARVLRGGGLVAFPTETVYGLGADALNPDAVQRIFAVKGRPSDNPLIVHVADLDDARAVAATIPTLATRLAATFWPGPLTLVLDAADSVPEATTGGLTTVAVRSPAHPVARELLRLSGVPTAAPSANRSGRPSPTTAGHVIGDLPTGIDIVIDGGRCQIGIESTVVDARGAAPVILRAGSVTAADLDAAVRQVAAGRSTPGNSPAAVHTADRTELVASPGTRHAHYQPRAAVHIAPEGGGADAVADLVRHGPVGYLGIGQVDPVPGVTVLGSPSDSAQLAFGLYAALRQADDVGLPTVIVEAVAPVGIGAAVMDRLRRAAS